MCFVYSQQLQLELVKQQQQQHREHFMHNANENRIDFHIITIFVWLHVYSLATQIKTMHVCVVVLAREMRLSRLLGNKCTYILMMMCYRL